MTAKIKTGSTKLLEVTMRDVLDGLEDAASYMNYHSVPDTVEILSIEPPGRQIQLNHENSEIIQFHPTDDPKRSSNIVEYLVQRELKKTA